MMSESTISLSLRWWDGAALAGRKMFQSEINYISLFQNVKSTGYAEARRNEINEKKGIVREDRVAFVGMKRYCIPA